jgi:hypothetical protein
MTKSIFALAFALCVLPLAAVAQDAGAPAQATDAQHQQMGAQFQQFMQQEQQLHDQLRQQVLATLTPMHRRAIAAWIGELAVSPNPDVDVLAQRIDALLGSRERSQIMAAHTAFAQQSRQLHEQMKAAMQNEMPDHPMGEHTRNGQHPPTDVGHILLGALQLRPFGMMGQH